MDGRFLKRFCTEIVTLQIGTDSPRSLPFSHLHDDFLTLISNHLHLITPPRLACVLVFVLILFPDEILTFRNETSNNAGR